MVAFVAGTLSVGEAACRGCRALSACARRRHSLPVACADGESLDAQPRIERRAQPDPKVSARQAASSEPAWLEDMTSRRMGSGSIFYGKRESSDEIVARSTEDSAPKDPRGELLDYRPTPLVVIGASDRDLLGQLIALGLTNINFNVRVLTNSLARAEEIYGPDGANLDILVGDVSDPEWLTEAMRGAVGVVWSRGEGESSIAGIAAPWRAKEGRLDELQAALQAAKATKGVTRFVGVAGSDEEADVISGFHGKYAVICPPRKKKGSFFGGGNTSSLLDVTKTQRSIKVDSSKPAEAGSVSRLNLSQVCIDILQTDAFCGAFGRGVQKEVFIPDDIKEQALASGVESINLTPFGSRTIYVADGPELSVPLTPRARRDAIRCALRGEVS